jgi:hypothetical protein
MSVTEEITLKRVYRTIEKALAVAIETDLITANTIRRMNTGADISVIEAEISEFKELYKHVKRELAQ